VTNDTYVIWEGERSATPLRVSTDCVHKKARSVLRLHSVAMDSHSYRHSFELVRSTSSNNDQKAKLMLG